MEEDNSYKLNTLLAQRCLFLLVLCLNVILQFIDILKQALDILQLKKLFFFSFFLSLSSPGQGQSKEILFFGKRFFKSETCRSYIPTQSSNVHRVNCIIFWSQIKIISLGFFFIFPYTYFYRATSLSLIAQLVKNLPAIQETLVQFLGWEDLLRRDRLPTPVFLAFPCGSPGKESACNAGDLGSIPGMRRSPGEDSSILAQRIPWTVQSIGLQRVEHN